MPKGVAQEAFAKLQGKRNNAIVLCWGCFDAAPDDELQEATRDRYAWALQCAKEAVSNDALRSLVRHVASTVTCVTRAPLCISRAAT